MILKLLFKVLIQRFPKRKVGEPLDKVRIESLIGTNNKGALEITISDVKVKKMKKMKDEEDEEDEEDE